MEDEVELELVPAVLADRGGVDFKGSDGCNICAGACTGRLGREGGGGGFFGLPDCIEDRKGTRKLRRVDVVPRMLSTVERNEAEVLPKNLLCPP
jgi:hypothetical protein